MKLAPGLVSISGSQTWQHPSLPSLALGDNNQHWVISKYWVLSKIRLGQQKCCSCCLDEWHWNFVHVHSLLLSLHSSFCRASMFPVQGTQPLSQMNYPKHFRHFKISCQIHKTSLTSAGNESDVLWQSQAGQQRKSLCISRSEGDLNVPLLEGRGCVSRSDGYDSAQRNVCVEPGVPSSINTGFLWKKQLICGPCLTIRPKTVLFCDKE